MKKLLLSLVFGLVLIGSANALYVTTNTASTQWNSTVIAANGYNSSDYMLLAGCQTLTFTAMNPFTSVEVVWYLGSANTVVSRETISNLTTRTVRGSRAKVVIYSTPGVTMTAEARAY